MFKNISLTALIMTLAFCLINYADVGPKREDQIKKLQDLKVQLIFIRHGYSCANIVKDSGYKREVFTSYPDPELSLIGLNLSKENGKKLKQELRKRDVKIDFIASSSLIRAIETAYYIFGKKQPIYTVPYVAEKGNTPDNNALDVKEQREIISEKNKLLCNTDADCPIKFVFSEKSEGRSDSNYVNFVSWLGSNLDTILVENKQWAPINGGVFKIAIVTHSNFLGRELGLPYPANNAAFENTLEFQRQSKSDGGGWKFISAKNLKFVPINYGLTPAPDASHLKKALETLGVDRCRIDVTKGV